MKLLAFTALRVNISIENVRKRGEARTLLPDAPGPTPLNETLPPGKILSRPPVYTDDGATRMTADSPESDPADATESLVDYEPLRNRDDVRYHVERDVVDRAVVDQVADLPDLAGVGITNDDELLFRRLTDTCSWKIPVANVGPDGDYAAAIREHVRETVGFTLELDAVESVWHVSLETDDGEHTASRAFVVFGGSPVDGDYDLGAATPEGEAVEEVGWFADLPPEADEIPGTELFLD